MEGSFIGWWLTLRSVRYISEANKLCWMMIPNDNNNVVLSRSNLLRSITMSLLHILQLRSVRSMNPSLEQKSPNNLFRWWWCRDRVANYRNWDPDNYHVSWINKGSQLDHTLKQKPKHFNYNMSSVQQNNWPPLANLEYCPRQCVVR